MPRRRRVNVTQENDRVYVDMTLDEARTLATVLEHVSGHGAHERKIQRLRIALHKSGAHRYRYGAEIVVGARNPDHKGRRHATLLLYDNEAHRRHDEWTGGHDLKAAGALSDSVPSEQTRSRRPRAIKLEE